MDNGASSYRRYLEGDDNALGDIIGMYNEGISLYINSIVHNICLAEEIMQVTFFKIAVKKPKYREKYSFKTWLFTIARNTALDYLRRNSRISKIPLDESFSLSDEADIELQYLKEEQRIAVHSAIKNLRSEYSQVLYLMYFEGFDTEDISDIMSKSKKQIGDLVYRAKKALKKQLEKEGFEYEEF